MPRTLYADCPECEEGEIEYKRWDDYRMKGPRNNKIKVKLVDKECSKCGSSGKELKNGLKRMGIPL